MKQQKIKGLLEKTANEHNVITFSLSTGKFSLDLDDDSNGNQIKELFAHLLEEVYQHPITIEAEIPPERANDLYGNVSKAYIRQLNEEIARVNPEVENFKAKCNIPSN